MTTPLMLMLSCITPTLEYDHPVDTMYLNRNDRALLMKEVSRLGSMLYDDAQILMTTDILGETVCDTSQIVNSVSVDINPATAVILTRLRECYTVFRKSTQAADDIEVRDLDTDAIIMKLEGNPYYIYTHVYNMMENTALDYDSRIMRLVELYNAITGFTTDVGKSDKQSFLMNRFKEQADLAFWQRLIYHDIMHQSLRVPERVTLETLEVVKRELKGMGFYGFVNPWAMYTEFASSRVNRKVELNISDEVVDFLRKVVMSGGAKV